MAKSGNKNFDFAIAGCGMAGASLACELSAAGAKVLVLEAEAHPAFHTTGRSAAFFMEGYGNEQVRKLTQASRAFFEQPPENFNQAPLLKTLGALYIATEKQVPQLEKTVHHLKEVIPDCARVHRDFLSEKIPALKAHIQHGYWEPNAREINVAELLQGYIKLAKRMHAEFVFSKPITQLSKQANGWLINQTFFANVLINAAGAWADDFAALAGAQKKGLIPKKRNVCIAKPVANHYSVAKWPLCIDIDEQFYFKPEGEYLLITPADEIPGIAHDAQADNMQIALGIERIKAVLDMEFSSIQHQWAGLRTFAADKSPVVGFDPDIKNFFWLAGQGGYGIQMAPALAKTACELCLMHNEIFEISPSRF